MPISDLSLLGYLYNTDKAYYHNYCGLYQKHFQGIRWKRLNILEIGVGVPDVPTWGGESLRMWKKYFPNSQIFGLDIAEKIGLEEDRIKIFCGDQSDPDFLRQVVDKIGRLDIVIDDGSHINEHVIASFNVLFPLLADEGIYVVEDVQTSYWHNHYGGDSNDLNNPRTMMTMLKSLADGLNFQEFIRSDYEPSYFDRHVVGLHFYHNLVFIEKGLNSEPGGTGGRPSLEINASTSAKS